MTDLFDGYLDLILRILSIVIPVIFVYLVNRYGWSYERNLKRKIFVDVLKKNCDEIGKIMKSMRKIQSNFIVLLIPYLSILVFYLFLGEIPTIQPYMDYKLFEDFIGRFFKVSLYSMLIMLAISLLLNILLKLKSKEIDWKDYLPYKITRGFWLAILTIFFISEGILIFLLAEINKFEKIPFVDYLTIFVVITLIMCPAPILHSFLLLEVRRNFRIKFVENNIKKLEENPQKVIVSTSKELIEGSILNFFDDYSLMLKENSLKNKSGKLFIPWKEILWIKVVDTKESENRKPQDKKRDQESS